MGRGRIIAGSARISLWIPSRPSCRAPAAWWDTHPTTGVDVKGRLISQWPNIVELATNAHRRFVDRTIIGWDIALTDQGPILIEGNAYPDTHFMQRVHRQFIGKSPMAPLLRQHLSRLAAHGPTIPPPGVEAVHVSFGRFASGHP